MAERSNRQTAAPLPFTTFGEIAALGFEAQVYCIGCKQWGQIEATGPRWSNRRFAGARLRCTRLRYDGSACRSAGQLSMRPADGTAPIVGQQYADLSCVHCVPPREIRDVRFDHPPWSAGRFKCPGCRRLVMMASRVVGEGPTPSTDHLRVSAKE